MRGKLKTEHEIEYAPKDAIYNNTKYINAPDEILEKLGWKLIVTTPMPQDAPKYKHYESHYGQDENTIFTVWELVDDSNEAICARLRQWFDNDYRKWNEMLTRFQALGISKEIVDEFREKTYSSLIELYAEAEVVRKEIEDLEGGVGE